MWRLVAGIPCALTSALEAVRMHLEEGKSIGQIAALFGCGRTVVHRAIKGG